MLDVPVENIQRIGELLVNADRPLKERFRALFTLKNIGGPVAIHCIAKAFKDDSALLKHEVAYCLGQMKDECANALLMDVLRDSNQQAIVRHEAAEALGAIGSNESIAILKEYLQDSTREVRETCELALDRIAYFENGDNPKVQANIYGSVDPAPPSPITDVEELRKTLLDPNASIFHRYQAMFALRDLKSAQAVKALCDSLKDDSALFKHEVAFVLGQLQDADSVAALTESLRDKAENEMVRHEAAEALGAIGSHDCQRVLNEYLHDDNVVVKESCEIALDMCEYENSPEFQYANALQIPAAD